MTAPLMPKVCVFIEILARDTSDINHKNVFIWQETAEVLLSYDFCPTIFNEVIFLNYLL